MRVSLSLLLLLLLGIQFPLSAQASTLKTVCGTREGTGGDVFLLAPNGQELITLARQGGSQALLNQTDRLLSWQRAGIGGSRNGRSYCLIASYGSDGQPEKILQVHPFYRPVTTRFTDR